MTILDNIIYHLSEVKHNLTLKWLEDKDKTNFKALTFQTIDRNLTSIEKQIKKL